MKQLRHVGMLACFLVGGYIFGQEAGKQADRTRQIRQAIQAANTFDKVNADSFSTYAGIASELLQERDSLRLQYDVYKTLSRAHYLTNSLQEMRLASEQALAIAQELGDSLSIARSYRSLAMAKPAVSQAEAKTFIQQAIDFSQGPNEAYKRTQILSYQIQAYLLKYEDPQKAQEIRKKVLQQAIEVQDTAIIAKSYESIGTYFRNFDVDSAIYYFSKGTYSFSILRGGKFIGITL